MKHTQAAKRAATDAHTGRLTEAQMYMVKYRSVQTRVQTHKHDAFSQAITQVGDDPHKYREEREPENAEM